MEIKVQPVTIVVGNRFASFGGEAGVITLSELLNALDGQSDAHLVKGMHYIPGQGLSSDTIEAVSGKARVRQMDEWFRAWETRARRLKANTALSHKTRAKNILVSVPRRIGDNCFEVDLDIDDESELMLDHVTCKHVQGMVLIEACRQTFLSVTQKFYLEDRPCEKYYFVINDIETKYTAFVFPIEAKIVYRILESDLTKAGKLKFMAHMAIIQNGITATEVTVRFIAFAHDMLSSKEGLLAQSCIAAAQLAMVQRLVVSKEMNDGYPASNVTCG